jgi:hypothetical protein
MSCTELIFSTLKCGEAHLLNNSVDTIVARNMDEWRKHKKIKEEFLFRLTCRITTAPRLDDELDISCKIASFDSKTSQTSNFPSITVTALPLRTTFSIPTPPSPLETSTLISFLLPISTPCSSTNLIGPFPVSLSSSPAK